MAANSTNVSSQKERSSMKSYRDMGYRDKPATPNSPSGTTVTTMYDHLLSPPSPAEQKEKNERLPNELLDEICNDFDIDDSMDLDLDDFCYNGSQQQPKLPGLPGSTGQWFGKGESDERRISVKPTSSGYATSDSLCAIAKLTHSITHENGSAADVESRLRESAEVRPATTGNVKQEPSEIDSEPIGNVNDTDQGKAAAAASKLALQKQLSDNGNAANSDMTRKRTSVETMSHDFTQKQSCSMDELPAPQGPPPVSASQRPPGGQGYVDYSYPDDYAMEDMAADTMINFSELPQQPNYYQCPQTAQDNLNLAFNMSLHQQPSAPQGFGSGASHIPSAHHNTVAAPNFGRMTFGTPQQFHTNDVHMGRASPQFRTQNPFQTFPTGQMQQHRNSFQPYQGGSTSGPSSLQSQSNFHRSESFPGAQSLSSGNSSTPSLSHTQSQSALQQHSPPQNLTQKSSASSSSAKSAAVSSSAPTSASSPSTLSASAVSRGATGIPGSTTGGTAGAPTTPAGVNHNTTSQQGFMQLLITDQRYHGSSAFRSHPLFPLLRDLIIADMNYYDLEFPHSLIENLPKNFDRLLRNYLSRNHETLNNYQANPSVESVVMDALKYAHHNLIDKIKLRTTQQQQQQHDVLSSSRGSTTSSMSGGPASTGPSSMSSLGEYCHNAMKHEINQGQANYGRNLMNLSQSSTPVSCRPPRRESGMVYGGDMGPQTPDSGYNQPLSVDTGCTSPGSSRHTTPLASAAQPQSTNMYRPGQNPPPHYHPHSGMPAGYSRSPQQPNPRNPYMTPHGGPPCPPPNYTVSPNNPPLSRHQQTMYEMGPPPPGPPTAGMYSDPNSPYDPYNSCMPPPPPAAHHPRLHHMGDPHLMYMNNINDSNLVRTMMEGSQDMSDAGSVMSGHSIQGSIKGQTQCQTKPTEGRKHASLPKEAVSIMLNWLREHQDKPYPNDDEKGMLIKQTGLSITQINYWFTNARRRLLPKWRGEDM